MGPVADGEHAHDVDLQRDDRAGGEADREIEREPPARVERDIAVASATVSYDAPRATRSP